jgi:cellulose synthase/poly-beta-1,6-N-acetylglucosamine synthase-like glycosyltransferase
MNNGTPTISIIVPCCNEKDHIEACLYSILAQKPPPGDFEMIVADGMSSDYVCQCLDVLQETGADNIGGAWVATAKGLVGQAIAAAFQSSFAAGGPSGRDPEYEGPLDAVYLGCRPRKVFDQIGYFDEELIRNQDDEFNLRLTRAGGKIWQSPRIFRRVPDRAFIELTRSSAAPSS